MRILFVANSYYPLIGGIETQLRLVAQALARQHQVEVVATNFTNDRPGRLAVLLERILVQLGVPNAPRKLALARSWKSFDDGPVAVHALTPSFVERLLLIFSCGLLFKAVYTRKLRPIVRGADVVHALKRGRLGDIAELLAREQRVPFAITPYIHPDKRPAGFRADFEERADLVFALLESDAAKLVDLGVSPGKIRLLGVVPLLPSTRYPDEFRARHALGRDPVVLFVGRVIRYKGVKALLDATQRVWQRMPAVHFVFAGPVGDEERRWFEERPDDRIRLLGPVGDQEKADAFAACDLFCMPSKYEILPAVYLEAWSCNKAVIGGTAFGLRELIEGNAAGVVADQDPDRLADSILDLLQDDAGRVEMGNKGMALVQSRFSEEALVRTLEGAYGELCAGRRQPARFL